MNLSNFIDYTFLKPTATERDIINVCKIAKANKYFSVCVNGSYVKLAQELLKDTEVKVCTVIGFPFGAMSTQSKISEAINAVADGAEEIDMVINLGYLKSSNYVSVLRDISDVKRAIGNTTLKVIIEISELNKNEIVKACEIAVDANADFVKTSTGFASGGATFTAVKIMKKTVKDSAKIKASGGISDFETAVKYLEAGADRIGTSSVLKPEKDTLQKRNSKIYRRYMETSQKSEVSLEVLKDIKVEL
ncbi:deoxyribose-phosphate aldolase [Hyunsoonleella jejuensis]|uniref:Deoxyribose-phosphate aldolase n=1 Tax=Hyunsoonleella jejuensis TaxID=419940 RepID=A0A1H9GTW2_9FLAO|nr:deoxyribose-phosphate aldolase [Hyunsoonleella jejuensis]SEQ53504.1 deoxyribose-phosphate aldolase [Hyunsoonleella jejuensis]